ncbi:unnamed protein product, partial [marine sediment metagenome]
MSLSKDEGDKHRREQIKQELFATQTEEQAFLVGVESKASNHGWSAV